MDKIRRATRTLALIAAAAAIAFAAAIYVVDGQRRRSPSYPDPATGHVIAYRVNRATVYVTATEKRISRILTYGLTVSTALALALGGVSAAPKGRS